MPADSAIAQFKAALKRPATPKGAQWTFVLLPAQASQSLPSRGPVALDLQLQEAKFTAVAEPDGQGGHWLKVPRSVMLAASALAGQTVALQLSLARKQPEPKLPSDLRRALAASLAASAQWVSLTPAARRDWIFWLDTAKKRETRLKRLSSACDMLASGKRRVCCFDRSGIYAGGTAAPREAD